MSHCHAVGSDHGRNRCAGREQTGKNIKQRNVASFIANSASMAPRAGRGRSLDGQESKISCHGRR